jgi:hypothetical protein
MRRLVLAVLAATLFALPHQPPVSRKGWRSCSPRSPKARAS